MWLRLLFVKCISLMAKIKVFSTYNNAMILTTNGYLHSFVLVSLTTKNIYFAYLSNTKYVLLHILSKEFKFTI